MANSDSTIVYIAPGKVVEVDPRGTTVLDGMVEAQDDYGQITWTTVRPTTCFGHAAAERVAVFDLSSADGLDVIHVTYWVNGHTDAEPEVS